MNEWIMSVDVLYFSDQQKKIPGEDKTKIINPFTYNWIILSRTCQHPPGVVKSH